jgi:hypothetical protein
MGDLEPDKVMCRWLDDHWGVGGGDLRVRRDGTVGWEHGKRGFLGLACPDYCLLVRHTGLLSRTWSIHFLRHSLFCLVDIPNQLRKIWLFAFYVDQRLVHFPFFIVYFLVWYTCITNHL